MKYFFIVLFFLLSVNNANALVVDTVFANFSGDSSYYDGLGTKPVVLNFGVDYIDPNFQGAGIDVLLPPNDIGQNSSIVFDGKWLFIFDIPTIDFFDSNLLNQEFEGTLTNLQTGLFSQALSSVTYQQDYYYGSVFVNYAILFATTQLTPPNVIMSVPEPETAFLMILGILAIFSLRNRKIIGV